MKEEKKDIFRLPIIVFALFVVSLFILFYIDNRINESKKQDIINNEKRLIELNTGVISNDIRNVINDLHFLEGTYVFYLNNKIGFKNVEEMWKLFSEQSDKYDQIRFIDTNGNEKIRVNYSNQTSYICPMQELKTKKTGTIFMKQ